MQIEDLLRLMALQDASDLHLRPMRPPLLRTTGRLVQLAAMIKEILTPRLVPIVTIEDPIEFLLSDTLGSVSQREVGTDTPSFSEALRNTLRQDPDVIMVGEMRDRETVATVLTAAET